MNININFTEKTLQILNEVSVEQIVDLLTKMPELKEFKIVPNLQIITLQKEIPYNPNMPIIQPYYYLEGQKPYEVFCNSISDNSTSQYYQTLVASDTCNN
jgi:hypothetical protein